MRSIYTDEYEQTIAHLIDARKRAGMTQGQVGARLGRDQSFVSKYERKERRLDFVEFKHVCDVLGLDVSALLDSGVGPAASKEAATETKR